MRKSTPWRPSRPFVQQLFKLVTKAHVTWAADGAALVIPDTQRFAADRCPVYFKHSNWTSFARMLNMYEFRGGRARDGSAVACSPLISRATGPGSRAWSEEAGVFVILGGRRRARQVIGRGGRGTGSGVRRRLASPLAGSSGSASTSSRRRTRGSREEPAAVPKTTRAVRPHDVLRRRLPAPSDGGRGLLRGVFVILAPVTHRRVAGPDVEIKGDRARA